MCGIFTMLNNSSFNRNSIKKQFEVYSKLDDTKDLVVRNLLPKVDVGYGLNDEYFNTMSNQPIIVKDVALLCNGDIYNHREIYNTLDVKPTTEYSSEVIIHLYRKHGIEYTLQVIQGVFAFVLVDYRISEKHARLFVARDPFGVRPLYSLKPMFMDQTTQVGSGWVNNENIFAFAKDLKTLSNFEFIGTKDEIQHEYVIKPFQPGSYTVFDFPNRVLASWTLVHEEVRYYSLGVAYPITFDMDRTLSDIHHVTETAVRKIFHSRENNKNNKFACILSGGLNSSIVAAIAQECCKELELPPLETFSIGLEGSNDLFYSKIVANYLGTNHTEIVLTRDMLMNDVLPDVLMYVIYLIETYELDVVREGIFKWMLANYIYENSDARYILSGDGLNELTGCNLENVKHSIDFDSRCRFQLGELHQGKLLCSEKAVSNYKLHMALPFLDSVFVQTYMSIHPHTRYNSHINRDKYLMRMAFKDLLPENVVLREKELFSENQNVDGQTISQIFTEYAEIKIMDGFNKREFDASTKEEHLYRYIFTEIFGTSLTIAK